MFSKEESNRLRKKLQKGSSSDREIAKKIAEKSDNLKKPFHK